MFNETIPSFIVDASHTKITRNRFSSLDSAEHWKVRSLRFSSSVRIIQNFYDPCKKILVSTQKTCGVFWTTGATNIFSFN